MLGTKIHSSASSGEVAGVSLINESQIRIILLDIEGTTTPVDFVYQTLFPYATRMLESFLRDRKSTRLNSSHQIISYAVFCLKKKRKPLIKNSVEQARLRLTRSSPLPPSQASGRCS